MGMKRQIQIRALRIMRDLLWRIDDWVYAQEKSFGMREASRLGLKAPQGRLDRQSAALACHSNALQHIAARGTSRLRGSL
jgi:hypothetical protein